MVVIRHARANRRPSRKPEPYFDPLPGEPMIPMRPLNWDAPVWPNWRRFAAWCAFVAVVVLLVMLAWPRGSM